ncbi:MAG: SAM-dependent methyltransferase [Clostridiales bacterium]|nr:SAM-dependent methyltransferase [Clostridiales bacterium]
MFVADAWQEFEVLDAGDGMKLERWGQVILARPDPQVIWPKSQPQSWSLADGVYGRSGEGGGIWSFRRPLPERWQIAYRDLRFFVRPTGFKHTGLFPEQAANWDWMRGLVSARPGARVLNLFAYTGGASVALMKAGAHVTHVDAARGMVQWAKENRALSGVVETAGRYIVEDAKAFVQRELRRGKRYEGILMDPPSYGRGPGGEVWKLEDELFPLARLCANLLSDDPLFFLINGYTTGFQPAVLHNVLSQALGPAVSGSVDARELGLPITSGGILPAGASARWQAKGAPH